MMRTFYLILASVCVCVVVAHVSSITYAQQASELEARIRERTTLIKDLEKEIAEYQKQISELNSQASSLSTALKTLDLTQKKLAADIRVTENKIHAKTLEIKGFGIEIVGKEEKIKHGRSVIGHSLSLIDRLDSPSLPEIILGSQSLSEGWNVLDGLGMIQGGLVARVNELREDKAHLEVSKRVSEKAKDDLQKLNNQLKDQQQVVTATQTEKNKLLAETKQSESQYQKLLAQKKTLKEAFEREVLEYESQLRFIIDPNKLPHVGSGVLRWPVDVVRVTQYFGNTEFATANPQIYNGRGHTGVDFGASVGTPVKASLSGIVSGVGNTDLIPRCYSYGKWVMIKHANGLSTLYAHLSVHSVAVGQTVTTGEVIGYSGNTGYTTGPHLHFGVYATEGVRITTFDTSVNCRGAIIPLASFNAYLNPLSYL